LRKLSPFFPSISPGEKPSRSSSTSVLAISAGSMVVPCGAAALTDSVVNAGGRIADTCVTCLCVAASAKAKGNNARTKVTMGNTLIARQLCCAVCVPVLGFALSRRNPVFCMATPASISDRLAAGRFPRCISLASGSFAIFLRLFV
jgi:hypothetical protein